MDDDTVMVADVRGCELDVIDGGDDIKFDFTIGGGGKDARVDFDLVIAGGKSQKPVPLIV